MHFPSFNDAVAKKFATLCKGQVFRVNVSKDDLWKTYLASFPAGSDPIYRTRSEHDCNCCKQFIRAVGDVVGFVNGQMVSIWNVNIPGEPEYQAVANGLRDLCEAATIVEPFHHIESTAGRSKSFEQLAEGGVHTWDHFHVNIDKTFVVKNTDYGTIAGKERSSFAVFHRALSEMDMDSINTVLELIAQNSLYRGEEHKFAVTEFKKYKTQYDQCKFDRSLYTWSVLSNVPDSVKHFRNSVIGTLVTDLAEGVDMEKAVNSFEEKVAPSNYKRTTALVTKQMIENAKKKINELGLTSALERRYATLSDITINNVMFANRSTKKTIGGDVFDDMIGSVKSKKVSDKIEEIHIDKFITDVLPSIKTMELMVENTHTSNLVSLIAPVDPTAGRLFKWDNGFSWSYTGDVADSIKERVKQAGGNVTGELCCRLAWYNHDDLDLHMILPNEYEISFRNKRPHGAGKGELDVDMNAGCGTTRTPVENIFFPKIADMPVGTYKLFVHQWSAREAKDIGFDVEIDLMGKLYTFHYDRKMPSGTNVTVAEFTKTKNGELTLKSNLTQKSSSKQVWNINTMQFVNVNAMMLSPNHWDGHGVGNKHYFFMLDGCLNDGTARGFYNEFLRPELNEHRKVIEIVGSKMRAEESNNQLSGVGFSSTQRNSIVAKVSGSFERMIKIVF